MTEQTFLTEIDGSQLRFSIGTAPVLQTLHSTKAALSPDKCIDWRSGVVRD